VAVLSAFELNPHAERSDFAPTLFPASLSGCTSVLWRGVAPARFIFWLDPQGLRAGTDPKTWLSVRSLLDEFIWQLISVRSGKIECFQPNKSVTAQS
jgi:hypothetical protein